MKREFLGACTAFLLLFLLALTFSSVSAQNVGFSPSAGYPGDTVTFTNNDSGDWYCGYQGNVVRVPANGSTGWAVPNLASGDIQLECIVIESTIGIGTFTVLGGTPTAEPDYDGDGIPDDDDECDMVYGDPPTGCPDYDGDGFPDDVDACPIQYGYAPNGCPDYDGDGFPDNEDACPSEYGFAPNGCSDPNIIIASVGISPSPVCGEAFDVSLTIENIGTEPTEVGGTILVEDVVGGATVASATINFTELDSGGGVPSSVALSHNQSYTVTFTITDSPNTNHTIRVTADSGGNIAESNEGDNTTTSDYVLSYNTSPSAPANCIAPVGVTPISPTPIVSTATTVPGGSTQPDQDGDGTTDANDVCPTVPGPTWNSGCPVTGTSTTEPTCLLTPFGNQRVNVRQSPSLDAAVVTQLQPGVFYPAFGLSDDRLWYQVANGWVSAGAANHSRECPVPAATEAPPISTAAPTTPAPTEEPDATSAPQEGFIVQIATLEADLSQVLGECPDLLSDSEALVLQLQMEIATSSNPCEQAAVTIRNVNNMPVPTPALDRDTVQMLFDTCDPLLVARFIRFMGVLVEVDVAAWEDVKNNIRPEDACEFIANLGLPALTVAVEDTRFMKPAEAQRTTRFNQISIVTAWCSLDVPAARIIRTTSQLQTAGVTFGSLLGGGNPCLTVRQMHVLGDMTPDQIELFDVLYNECGYNQNLPADNPLSTPALVVLAIIGNVDIRAVLDEERETLCDDPVEVINGFAELAEPVVIPASLNVCPDVARLLRQHNESLTPAQLLTILAHPNACVVAQEFIWHGTLIPDPNLGLNVSCIAIDPFGSLQLPDALITETTEWNAKIAVADRPADQVCTTSPVPVEPTPPPETQPTAQPGEQPTTEPEATPVPVVDTQERVQVLLSGAELFQDAFAVFQVREDEQSPIEAYGFSGDSVAQLNVGVGGSQLFPSIDPAGGLLAYIIIDEDGNHTIAMTDLITNTTTPLFTDSATLTVGEFPVTWSPDGLSLLVTLIDSGGNPSVYVIDVSTPSFITLPVLLINNATSAAISPNGQYLAFERPGTDLRNIFLMLLANRTTNPLTQQPEETACLTPAFGADSLSIFFVCNDPTRQEIYQYGMAGVLTFETGVDTPANPAPGPVTGFIAFDDGDNLYLATFDDDQVTPLIQFDQGEASSLRWQAAS